MFMGHLGIALGAKGARPELPLLLLSVAATAPDLIDFTLEGLGHRQGAGLWTHSLPAMAAYGLLFSGAYLLAHRRAVAAALLLGLVACSHVLTDLITSRITLWRSGPVVGLHLYGHLYWDLLLECCVIVLGWVWYGRSLPETRRRTVANYALLAVLLAMQALTLIVRFS